MKRLEFINVTGSDVAAGLGDAVGVDESSRRRIRVQVMKDFWRKEKKQKGILPILKDSQQAQPLPAIPEPRIPFALYVPDLWRSSFALSLLEDHCYLSPHPSLMGRNVKTYFSRGRAPVTAILDSLIIMHVGSTAKDEGLLLEARKRYVFAITSLRLDTARSEPDMSLAGILMVAMGILLSEVLFPITSFWTTNFVSPHQKSTKRQSRRYTLLTHGSPVQIYSSASQGLDTSSWQCQVVGVSALVRARRNHHQDSGVERHLLQWLQLVQLLHALCNRKPFPEHIAIAATTSRSPSLASLLHIVSGVAPLLEAVDTAVSSTPGEANIDILFERLFVIETQLSAWLSVHLQNPETEHESENFSPSHRPKPNVFNLTCESLARISLLLTVESLNVLSHHQSHQTTTMTNITMTMTNTTTTIPSLEVLTAELCRTTTLLVSTASTPINRARAASGPIHFLREFFTRKGDEAGLRWCDELKGKVCGDGEGAAAFLRWDALLPWCLLDFHVMFVRD